jgi:hypothetical protein
MSAHLVFGNVKGGHPIIDTNFVSADIAHGTIYTSPDVSHNYLIVHTDELAWVAFSSDSTVDPDPSKSPRILVAAHSPFPFYIKPGTKIKTAAA